MSRKILRLVLLPMLALVWLPLGLQAQETQTDESTLAGEALKARVERRRGDVQYLKEGDADWQSLRRRIVLQEGDTVHTLPNAGALATLMNSSTLILDASTRLVVREMYRDTQSRAVHVAMDLAGGSVDCEVRPLPTEDSRYLVRTPTATAAVRGTKFRVSYLQGRSTITVLEGAVDVLDQSGREIRLADKMELETGLDGSGEPAPAGTATLTSMRQSFRNGQRGAPTGALEGTGTAVGGARDRIPMDTSEKRAPADDDDEF